MRDAETDELLLAAFSDHGPTVVPKVAGESDLDVYSEQSPLGAAINGKKAGETTTYDAPNGKSIEVEIVSAKPYES